MSHSTLIYLRQHWIHALVIVGIAVAVALSFSGSSASDTQGNLRSSRKLIRPNQQVQQVAPQVQQAPQAAQQPIRNSGNGYAATDDFTATDDYSATDDLRVRVTMPGENEIAIPGY